MDDALRAGRRYGNQFQVASRSIGTDDQHSHFTICLNLSIPDNVAKRMPDVSFLNSMFESAAEDLYL